MIIPERDSNGRTFTRNATTMKGWSYLAHFAEICTSNLTSGIYSEDHNGVEETLSFAKFFDVNGIELLTQLDIDTSCVKSVFTFRPDHSLDIIGGEVYQSITPLVDCRLHVVIGMLDADGNQISVKPFVQNMNLKFIDKSRTVKTDGRSSKFVEKVTVGAPYDTNHIQVVIRHPAGYQHSVMIEREYYRE